MNETNSNLSKNTKFWFKPKRYGWGFFPISWQGWLMTFGLIGLVLISAYTNNFFEINDAGDNLVISQKDGWRYFYDIIVLCILFILIAKDKTDGEVRWRWGK